MRAASFTVCWSPSITAQETCSFSRLRVSVSSVVFTGAGAGDQVQHQLFARGKAGAIAGGELVIFVQHVDLHLQHLALADARRVRTRFAVAVMEVARVGTLRGKGDAGQAAAGRGAGEKGAERNAEWGRCSSPSIYRLPSAQPQVLHIHYSFSISRRWICIPSSATMRSPLLWHCGQRCTFDDSSVTYS